MTTSVATYLNYESKDPAPLYPGTGEAANQRQIYLHEYNQVPMKIFDARGKEHTFSLDQSGFAIHQHASSFADFEDAEQVREKAYPETIELLKEKTGATHVIPIDHRTRVQTWDAAVDFAKTHGKDEYVTFKAPARFVHVDQSTSGAHIFLHNNVNDVELEAKLKRTRWGIINVWRPLKTVFRDPFAVCDGSTFPDADLQPRPIQMSNGKGSFKGVGEGDGFEIFVGKKGSGHQWWYLSEMQKDEVLLIKCFDSKLDGRVRRAPHTSFEDPRYLDREARESCEIRCLVFWEDQSVE